MTQIGDGSSMHSATCLQAEAVAVMLAAGLCCSHARVHVHNTEHGRHGKHGHGLAWCALPLPILIWASFEHVDCKQFHVHPESAF